MTRTVIVSYKDKLEYRGNGRPVKHSACHGRDRTLCSEVNICIVKQSKDEVLFVRKRPKLSTVALGPIKSVGPRPSQRHRTLRVYLSFGFFSTTKLRA
jgi:hypothetical protein